MEVLPCAVLCSMFINPIIIATITITSNNDGDSSWPLGARVCFQPTLWSHEEGLLTSLLFYSGGKQDSGRWSNLPKASRLISDGAWIQTHVSQDPFGPQCLSLLLLRSLCHTIAAGSRLHCFSDGALEVAIRQQPPSGLCLSLLLLSEFWVWSPLLSISRLTFPSSGHKLTGTSNLVQMPLISQTDLGSGPDSATFCVSSYPWNGNNDVPCSLGCREDWELKYMWRDWPGGHIWQGKHLSPRGTNNLPRLQSCWEKEEGPEPRPGPHLTALSATPVLFSRFVEKAPHRKWLGPVESPVFSLFPPL